MAGQSLSPAFPGVSRVGFVSLDAVTADMRVRAVAGFPFPLPADPTWIVTDGESRLEYSDQTDANAAEYTVQLTFSSRQPVPRVGVAWVAVLPDGRTFIVGWDRYAPGVMGAKSSTSSPGSDPVTVSYEFKSPSNMAVIDC